MDAMEMMGESVDSVEYKDIVLALVSNPLMVDFIKQAKSFHGSDAEMAGNFFATVSLAQHKLARDSGGKANDWESWKPLLGRAVATGLILLRVINITEGSVYPLFRAVGKKDSGIPVPPADEGWMLAYPRYEGTIPRKE